MDDEAAISSPSDDGSRMCDAVRSRGSKYNFVGGHFVGPPGGVTFRDDTAAGRLVDVLFGAFVWALGLVLGAPVALLLLTPFA